MRYLIPLVGLLFGFLIGQEFTFTVPPAYAPYLSIAILASLDAVLGGVRGALEESFDSLLFITGFFINSLVSAGLVFFGDYIGVNLYYVAIFVFGVRIFQNLAISRRLMINRFRTSPKQ